MTRRTLIPLAFAPLLAALSGCNGLVTQNQQATDQWNASRASALGGLAADQLRDGNLDKCQATLDQALRLRPDEPKLHLLAVKLSIEQNQMDLAEAHLARLRTLTPDDAEPDYLTGVMLERLQQPERAQAAYGKAFGKKPTEAAYLLAWAETLVALHWPDAALDLLQGKVRDFEHNALVRQEIGMLLAAKGRYPEAISELREACRLSPDDLTVREHLGFALYTSGDFAATVDVLTRLVKQDDYAARPDVFAALGESLGRTKRYYEAQQAYATAAKLDPATPGYWLGLTRVALQAGDVPAADQAVRRAVSLRPADAATHLLVGHVRLKQNQNAQALAAFHKAAELDPADPVALTLEGYVLAQTGRPADARACYARALALQPGNPAAGRLLASTAE